MDGRNRTVGEKYRPGMVSMSVRVPGELKYLVICYKSAMKMPSFNYAVQVLLETHPALAKLAAELVQSGNGDGLDTFPSANSGELSSELRTPDVAGLFHGYLYRGQVPDPWCYYAFC